MSNDGKDASGKKAPEELKHEDLDKVAGGLDSSTEHRRPARHGQGGSAGNLTPKTSPDQIRGNNK